MKNRTFRSGIVSLWIFFYFSSLAVYAQENHSIQLVDSVADNLEKLYRQMNEPVGLTSPFVERKEVVNGVKQPSLTMQKDYFDFRMRKSERDVNLFLPYYTNPSSMFKGDYRTGGYMGGGFYGSGSQTTVPGIGVFNEASLTFKHQINPYFEFQVGADALKANVPLGVGQAFRASGALLYRPTDKLRFKAFGAYAVDGAFGNYTHSYGASVSYDATDRFGMEVGIQRYYDAMRGGWQTVPMVVPYYKFDKFELGIDVGGILYEVLRTVVFDKRNQSMPTIAPPKFQFGR